MVVLVVVVVVVLVWNTLPASIVDSSSFFQIHTLHKLCQSLHFYTFLTVVVRYWCRVSGLVPFSYLCRLQCCCSHYSYAFYFLTMRSSNKKLAVRICWDTVYSWPLRRRYYINYVACVWHSLYVQPVQ